MYTNSISVKLIYNSSNVDKSGTLDKDELTHLLKSARKDFPQFDEHVRKFQISKSDILHSSSAIELFFDAADKNKDGSLDLEEFKEMLHTMDTYLRALPATAQVANQQGKVLRNNVQ